MNRSALKKYAPQARLDFIEAVTLRARRLGLDPTLPVSVEQAGDVLLIGGQPFPASFAKQRSVLAQRIQQQGFSVVVEALAYTWFNRLVAIRFMELKGYLSHGYRVLSHSEGQQPEILEHAQHLDLPGLDKTEVIRLKTAGNQDEALYREILLAQCHELHRNMPFLFEALDDATELLLPDNLLRTDSLIAHLVGDIEEGDWEEVEIIGWLYQFYISDKKDEVIGKVVKSEDIPAATQLFTPNWIVQYLVQNSLGRLWLMANPGSSLKDKMPYYIEPAEQTPEVQAQLDALIKVRMDEDGGTLNPESLTVLDPACGSGHILVEAYNLLRTIYEERGYRLREIPRLILQKNLYGLDIDDRAVQLAGFALLMKAREDDRRLFDEEGNPPHFNVMAIQQSAGLPDEDMARVILNAAIQIDGGDAFRSGQLFGGGKLETQHSSGLTVLDLRQLILLFEHGKTFGSLLSVPGSLRGKIGKIIDLLTSVQKQGDDLSRSYAIQVLEQFALPASLLSLQYDAVVANPPYMGSGYYNDLLSGYVENSYRDWSGDLFTSFMRAALTRLKASGVASYITISTWTFLPTYQGMREQLLRENCLLSIVDNGRGVWGSDHGSLMFSIQRCHVSNYMTVGKNLSKGKGKVQSLELIERKFHTVDNVGRRQAVFLDVPSSIISVGVSESFVKLLSEGRKLGDVGDVRQGIKTGDMQRFMRYWHEVDYSNVIIDCQSARESKIIEQKWYPCNKGGEYRKWYGNLDYVLNWKSDGEEIKGFKDEGGKLRSRPQNIQFFFKEGVTWSTVTMGKPSFRYSATGRTFESGGSTIFFRDGFDIYFALGVINSFLGEQAVTVLSPKVSLGEGAVSKFPLPELAVDDAARISKNAQQLVELFKGVERASEASLDFVAPVAWDFPVSSISDYYQVVVNKSSDELSSVIFLERSNNKIVADGLGVEFDQDIEAAWEDFGVKSNDCFDFARGIISYAAGCMFGRFSLDETGLIYAGSGGVGFDSSRYLKFPADADGIIPITDESWFEDDAAERIREFFQVVWGNETLVDNMEWLADSLGRKAGESADEGIRRYLSTSFYKDHLQTYKKRPIYWLFSSGKQKAFECLVYLHRYNEGTLSRMRMEYVVPLQSRMQARIDKLTDDIDSATSSAQQKTLQKRKDKLTKQLEELRRFDENLRPYADQRITLDLDDGVKVNYGKFGNLLAEVKAITGGKED